jgi:geranylgeranyl diphosphate synthase, type II
LQDWQGDSHNKLSAGGDVLGGRPTVLWALACEGLAENQRAELLAAIEDTERPAAVRVQQVRTLYQAAGVFEKAQRLVDKHQQRAEAIADELQPDELRRLLYYLIDTVLERQDSSPPMVTVDTIAPLSPSK